MRGGAEEESVRHAGYVIGYGAGQAFGRNLCLVVGGQECWIGHQCREVLISLGQAVYDSKKHPTTDGVAPSDTDAKRMLDGYIAAEMRGASNKTARTHATSSLDLANQLLGRGTIQQEGIAEDSLVRQTAAAGFLPG